MLEEEAKESQVEMRRSIALPKYQDFLDESQKVHPSNSRKKYRSKLK